MAVGRGHEELAHTVGAIHGRLQDDGPAADELIVKCVGIVHMQIAEIAVITGVCWREGIRAVAQHDAHGVPGNQLPTRTWGPLESEAERIAKIRGTAFEIGYRKHVRERTKIDRGFRHIAGIELRGSWFKVVKASVLAEFEAGALVESVKASVLAESSRAQDSRR